MSSANPNAIPYGPTDWDEWLNLARGVSPVQGLGQVATEAGGDANVAQVANTSESEAEEAA